MKTDLKTLRNYQISNDADPMHEIPYKRDVQGYRVIFNELPDMEFFVHRENKYSPWKFSDAKFGLAFPEKLQDFDRKTAINHNHEYLLKFGIEKFLNVTIPKAEKLIKEKFPTI